MEINVNVKIVPFGKVRLEIGKPVPLMEEHFVVPVQKEIHYREPQETASRIYEIQYQEELKNYVVPLTTG